MDDFYRVWESIRVSSGEDFEVNQDLKSIIREITETILTDGYDHFSEQLTSHQDRSGRDPILGATRTINVIPQSSFDGSCAPLVLVVAKEKEQKFRFKEVMRALRSHLINCAGTKTVVILTDVWQPSLLRLDEGDWRAHGKKGVNFVWLLVSDSKLTHIPVV